MMGVDGVDDGVIGSGTDAKRSQKGASIIIEVSILIQRLPGCH